MATRQSDYHYLRTNIDRSEPRRYASLEAALSAMKDLLHLQGGRGFVTERESDGKHTSRHPDGNGRHSAATAPRAAPDRHRHRVRVHS